MKNMTCGLAIVLGAVTLMNCAEADPWGKFEADAYLTERKDVSIGELREDLFAETIKEEQPLTKAKEPTKTKVSHSRKKIAEPAKKGQPQVRAKEPVKAEVSHSQKKIAEPAKKEQPLVKAKEPVKIEVTHSQKKAVQSVQTKAPNKVKTKKVVRRNRRRARRKR